jgi:ABC-type cobalamin/Fe3+-siderophores transport system ATPase subunit
MDEILIDDITFAYPETGKPVFEHLSISLPKGITVFIGQNATGKSTLMLLAGGILLPEKGRVLICDIDSRNLRDEKERQRLVSFIYQNMEFETEEDINTLLHFVYENGWHKQKDERFVQTLIDVFELSSVLNKKTQNISKGELQRTILAFSLLFGSRIIIMDEPIFAIELHQKERAMKFITGYAKDTGITVIYSVHDLDIVEKYSENILLFHKSGRLQLGTTGEIFKREILEEAYQIPYTMLKTRELLYREILIKKNNFSLKGN